MPNRAAGYPVEIRGPGTIAHKDRVQRAKQRLKAGKTYRAAEREDIWARNELQYIGDHWDGVDQEIKSTHDIITINMSFSTVNTIVPYMTGSEPNFLVVPYGNGATARNAAIQQAYINRIWRGELSGQDELESAAVDFIIYGDGFLKTGYDLVEKRIDTAELLGNYVEIAQLWVMRVNPWDVWIDPASDGIHNARWVCHRFRLTKPEVDQMGWKNVDTISYSNSWPIDSDEHGSKAHRQQVLDNTEYAVIYEFYDLVENYSVIFPEGGNSPLAMVEDVPKCPIVQMGNYRIPNSPYHMSELEQLYDIQLELNKTRTQMINHRARNAQKFAVQKGRLDDDAMEALQSPTVNEAIEVETQGQPIDQIIQPLQVPNLSADVYNVSDVLEHDIYEISGVNEYLRGGTPNVRRTATEATIIEGASNVKSQFKLRQVEKASRAVGTLLLGFAADIYPQTDYEEMTLYLAGREAELISRATPAEELVDADGFPMAPEEVGSLEISPGPDIFVGTYEVLVEASSTELRNPVMREQKYRGLVMDLLPAAGALMQMGVVLDIRKMLELWFEAAGIDDIPGMFLSPDLSEEVGPSDPLAEPVGGRPDEILSAPPDAIMGLFTPENTGMLEPTA